MEQFTRERIATMTDSGVQEIYFDESGFTGNNLLDISQPYFSYASIAIDAAHASAIVDRITRKHGLAQGELKGQKLIRHARGRRAIIDALDQTRGYIKVALSNKKFALGAKFFEYIFEPCLSAKSSLFYGTDFHKFIATYLFMEFTARADGAEEIFADFERMMRTRAQDGFRVLFTGERRTEMSPVLTQISDVALLKRDVVAAELESLPGDGAGKWVLDLTYTSLFTLLAEWGQKFHALRVYCDESKPLQSDQAMFNVMIGREEKKFIEGFGRKYPITFNLSAPISFVDSKVTAGIQLADVIARAVAYSVTGKAKDELTSEMEERLPEMLADGSIMPDFRHIDLNRLEVQRNAVLLLELHTRAVRGQSLLTGIGEYIAFISEQLRSNPIPLGD